MERTFNRRRRLSSSFSIGAVLPLTITADVSTLTMNISFTYVSISVMPTVTVVNAAAFVLSTINVGVNGIFNTGCGSGTRFLNNTILVLLKLGVLLRSLKLLPFWLVAG